MELVAASAVSVQQPGDITVPGRKLLDIFRSLPEKTTTCSLQTLHGTMAYANVSWSGGVASAGSAMESYDGMGHFKYHEVDSDGYTTQTYDYHGTYTITANCIASVIYYEGGPVWKYFVAPDGSAYYWVNAQNTGRVSTNRADRISRALLVQ